jgi:hypothetical protein
MADLMLANQRHPIGRALALETAGTWPPVANAVTTGVRAYPVALAEQRIPYIAGTRKYACTVAVRQRPENHTPLVDPVRDRKAGLLRKAQAEVVERAPRGPTYRHV